AERERLHHTPGRPVRSMSNVVTKAMEMSLAHQGHRVTLDPDDLATSVKKLTGRPMDQGFVFADLVYVIDLVGVKAKRDDTRYVARSYPISFDELPAHLKLGRPILAGVQVFESWFREPSAKTGVIDAANPGYRQGGILGVIVGWEPGKKEVKVLTPWPTWGDHGVTGDVRRRVVRVVV